MNRKKGAKKNCKKEEKDGAGRSFYAKLLGKRGDLKFKPQMRKVKGQHADSFSS